MKTKYWIGITILLLVGLAFFMWTITPYPPAHFINIDNPISTSEIGSMIKTINSRGG